MALSDVRGNAALGDDDIAALIVAMVEVFGYPPQDDYGRKQISDLIIAADKSWSRSEILDQIDKLYPPKCPTCGTRVGKVRAPSH